VNRIFGLWINNHYDAGEVFPTVMAFARLPYWNCCGCGAYVLKCERFFNRHSFLGCVDFV
jgi:hypothetical protein